MEINQPIKSLYRRIAIDIATDIASGKYAQGEKLFGRSVLASRYKVSPETIRKAIFLLTDVGITQTERGSGINVVSREKAKDFVMHNTSVDNLNAAKREIKAWAREQAKQADDILRKIQYVINETERINITSPLKPMQIKIDSSCKAIGKTINELNFWQNTGGTIIAIRREGALIVSPGPYATFLQDDIFFVIGDEDSSTAIMRLLYE